MIYDVFYFIMILYIYIYQTPSVSFFVFQHSFLLLLCSFWCQVISSGHGEWKLIDICSAEVGSDREETKKWRVQPLKTNMEGLEDDVPFANGCVFEVFYVNFLGCFLVFEK